MLGILGSLATLLLSNFAVDRKEALDSSIVQAELSDIQRAFQALNNDCVLVKDDYNLIAKYGLAVLMATGSADSRTPYRATTEDSSFCTPGNTKKMWRGPYVEREGFREIDPTTVGQKKTGSVEVPVVQTPFSKTESDESYYRVVATIRTVAEGKLIEEVVTPADSRWGTAPEKDIQLWVLSPDAGVVPGVGANIEEFAHGFRRRLLLNRE